MRNIKYVVSNSSELEKMTKIAEEFLGKDSTISCTMSTPFINYELNIDSPFIQKIAINKNFNLSGVFYEKLDDKTKILITYGIPEPLGGGILNVVYTSSEDKISLIYF